MDERHAKAAEGSEHVLGRQREGKSHASCGVRLLSAALATLLTLTLWPTRSRAGTEPGESSSAPKIDDDPASPAPSSKNCEEESKLGLRYELESIRIRGNERTHASVILRYVPFRAGEQIDVEDGRLALTRYRLLGTGYFRDAQLSLSKGHRRGSVILNVEVVERNTMVLHDVRLGLSADVTPGGASRPLTAFGGIDAAETNLLGTGISLGGALAVADRQAAYRLRFTDPSFLRTRWIVSASLLFNDARDFFGTRDVSYEAPTSSSTSEKTDYAVMTYQRRGGHVDVGYDVTPTTRLFAGYGLELIDADIPPAASQRRGRDIEPIAFYLLPARSMLSTVSVRLDDDTRDEAVLPTRGHQIQFGSEFGLPAAGSDYAFLRLQLRAAQWFRLGIGGAESHVLRLEAFGGAIFGEAPLWLRFYVGDLSDFLPGRVLDLNFDRRPSPNFLRTSVVEMRYEQFAGKLSAEYRIPVYRGEVSIYGIDLFGSAGIFAIGSQRDVSAPTGSYRGLARFPVDLTFNLGMRVSTKVGGFVVALANMIGFPPVRSEGGN